MDRGIKEPLVRLSRLLLIATVTASTVAVVFSLAMIAIEGGTQSTQCLIANIVGCLAFCLSIGFVIVAFLSILSILVFLLHRALILLMKFPQYLVPGSLRSAFVYAIVLVTIFTALLLRSGTSHMGRFVVSYVLCSILGAVVAALWMHAMKRNISRGELVFQKITLADSHPRGYWKDYFIVFGIGAAMLFLCRHAPGSSGFSAAPFGFFLGIGLYGFLWVCRYEKRNNIRIAIGRMECDRCAESW